MSEPIDEIREALKAMAANLPLCPEYMYVSVRHVQRNEDLECCGEDGHECRQPSRYDGPHIATVMNAAPQLLARLALLEQIARDLDRYAGHLSATDDEPIEKDCWAPNSPCVCGLDALRKSLDAVEVENGR